MDYASVITPHRTATSSFRLPAALPPACCWNRDRPGRFYFFLRSSARRPPGGGATQEQAASGLLALTLAFGLGVLWLSWRSRLPVTLAWSTPGAALLAGTGVPDGGWPAAVGAFLIAGVLIALTGLIPALGKLMAKIPTALAQAMLAGVLLSLCLAPFKALGTAPLLVAPVILCWLVMMKLAPRWSVPAALLVALAVIGIYIVVNGVDIPVNRLLPELQWTTPAFTPTTVAGIALPLFIVTMASQNIPGVAVLKSFGYTVPWRQSMLVTGAGTALGAPFGGHAINLAALSAALAAGEEAGADRGRRWIAAFTSGLAYLMLAAFSAALVTVVAAARQGSWKPSRAWPCWAPWHPPSPLPWLLPKNAWEPP
ncbi:inner membrane protein YdcO [Arthrobacter sp. Hiyo8]|nr:inner membrane protein YdcO [Arthrobacter sp. Hiyo8]